MKTQYQIKLLKSSDGSFSHNVYIICEKVKKTGISTIDADGIKIDFILEIDRISIYA